MDSPDIRMVKQAVTLPKFLIFLPNVLQCYRQLPVRTPRSYEFHKFSDVLFLDPGTVLPAVTIGCSYVPLRLPNPVIHIGQ